MYDLAMTISCKKNMANQTEIFALSNREKHVYNCLEDDLSKAVFTVRKLYSEHPEVRRNYESLFYGVTTRTERFDELIYLLSENPFVVYGAGYRGDKTLSVLSRFNVLKNCLAIWDNDPKKQGGYLFGIPICAPFSHNQCDFYTLIALSERLAACKEVEDSLKKNGINSDKIIKAHYLIFQHKIEYFDREIIPQRLGTEEIFVDVGCLDFLNSEQFLKIAPGVKKIYTFEPDESSAGRGKQSIGIIKSRANDCGVGDIVHIEDCGLWSSVADVRVCDMSKGSLFENQNTTFYKCNTLDNIIPQNERVTFIKADIEGAEMQMLIGAKETIKRCKPILAIKVYHRLNDYFEIAEYILNLVPEYKLWLRHESWTFEETVLYCAL